MSNVHLIASTAAWLSILLPGAGFGQTFELQAPTPSPKNMLSIHAVSADEAWVTAGSLFAQTGDLVHTTDGGKSFSVLPVNSTTTLNAVHFLDAQHGWCAGNGMFHTTDGGQTWIQDNDWGSIYTLFFVDELHGWAGGNGGFVYRTVDGGQTWAIGVSVQSGWTVRELWFSDALNGFAISIDGSLSRTTDGGLSWTKLLDLTPTLSDPFPNTTSIDFVSATEGWIIGGETFLHTTDAGISWQSVNVPSGIWAQGADFADALHGVAVGDEGSVVRTDDGGATWTSVQLPMAARLWDVSFAEGVAYACGSNGLLLRSNDFGATWKQISSGAAHTARDLSAIDGHRAWAANENGEIALTTNGGQLWERINVDGFDEFGDLWCVDFIDENFGWAAGQQQVFGSVYTDGRIARSTDGGRTWTQKFTSNGFEFFGLVALDQDSAIAFGRGTFASSAFVRTDDGGATWQPSGPAGTQNGFRAATFLPGSQTGWLVGNAIHKTTDGGLTWTKVFDSPVMLASVSFADEMHGWASGFVNSLYRTTDGGATWTPQNAGGPAGIAYMGVEAVGPDEAYLVGWQRYVAHTVNGGANWQPLALPPVAHNLYPAPSVEWNAVAFADSGNGWIAGNEGTYAMQDNQSLVATPSFVSAGIGGVQHFTLRPGVEHAGEVFVLLGSLSGTQPGLLDPASGLTLPLVNDGYFQFLLNSLGGGLLSPMIGIVNDEGFGASELRIPVGLNPGFVGMSADHAYATFDLFGAGGLTSTSNAVQVTLHP
jgi:photosystem II stability/assembly factor-like uncharacterized protein